jgi:hypothetical protein
MNNLNGVNIFSFLQFFIFLVASNVYAIVVNESSDLVEL